MTIFYSFLFSINPPVQPDCENKLKELNYTYEYNQEDAFINHRRYSRYRIDTIPQDIKLDVKSTYNCFRLALEADTNKVLLISYYPLFEAKKFDEHSMFIRSRHLRRSISRLVFSYNLNDHQVYYNTSDKTQDLISRYKAELLDKTDSKVKSENVTFWADACKGCPF